MDVHPDLKQSLSGAQQALDPGQFIGLVRQSNVYSA